MGDVFRKKKSPYWWGKVKDPLSDKWEAVSTRCTDRNQARRRLVQLQRQREADALRTSEDPEGAALVKARGTSLGPLLGEYCAWLASRGRTANYVRQVRVECLKGLVSLAGEQIDPSKRLFAEEAASWEKRASAWKLALLTPEGIEGFLDSLPQTLSPTAVNTYRTSLAGFCSWLVAKKRLLPYSPMASVPRRRKKAVRKRRALSPAEIALLCKGARERHSHHPGSGDYAAYLRDNGAWRARLYAAAFYTGLRKAELLRLRVKHLALAGEHPHLLLPGEFTKNREDALLYLPPAFAKELGEALRGKEGEDPVFPLSSCNSTRQLTYKKDLAFAGIEYRDSQGRYADFHSLRKSLATWLRGEGFSPEESRVVMRHSDIRLTLQTYQDEERVDARKAVAKKLPEVL